MQRARTGNPVWGQGDAEPPSFRFETKDRSNPASGSPTHVAGEPGSDRATRWADAISCTSARGSYTELNGSVSDDARPHLLGFVRPYPPGHTRAPRARPGHDRRAGRAL